MPAGGLHIGGEPGYNPRPDRNWGNAGGGRDSIDTRREEGTARGGGWGGANKLPEVAEEAILGLTFTFERAHAVQCEKGVRYEVDESSPEAEYFLPVLEQIFKDAHASIPQQHVERMHWAFTDAPLVIEYVQYGQLQHVKVERKHIDAYGKEESPDCYEMYDIDKERFVVKPDGQHFSVKPRRVWWWSFEVMVFGKSDALDQVGTHPDGSRFQCAAKISVVRLADKYIQRVQAGQRVLDAKAHSVVLKVEYGHIQARQFVEWPSCEVQLKIVGAAEDLVKIEKWPAPPESEAEEGPDDSEVQDKYTFKIENHKTCYWKAGTKRKDGAWIVLCDFAITGLKEVYEYYDRTKGEPWYRLTCYHVLDASKPDVAYITPEVQDEITDDTGRIEGEVLIQLSALHAAKDMRKEFAQVSAYFTMPNMSVDHLLNLVSSFEPPTPLRICTFFGRQPRSNVFMLGNCAFEGGRQLTHEQANFTVLTRGFTDKEAVIPLLQDEFPCLALGVPEWAQYALYLNTWNKTMPEHFLNNELHAKAAFAIGVMHLQCSRFWDGQGVGQQVPVAWLKSTAANTGKTHAVDLVNCFMGWRHKTMSLGSQQTMASYLGRLVLTRDQTFCLDELATKAFGKEDVNKIIKDVVHTVADGGTREVCNKVQRVKSSLMGSANIIVNENDDAFLQRLILLLFNELDASKVDPATTIERDDNWVGTKQLISCLQPAFESITWDGKLDKQAISDWCTFMNLATKTTYARNANFWGFVGYYMSLLQFLADPSGLDRIFDFLCHNVVQQNYMATKHSKMINQFLFALVECITTAAANPKSPDANKTFYWHNYRTLEKPNGWAGLGNTKFLAIRLDHACLVIKSALKKHFTKEEIDRQLKDCGYAYKAKCLFWNQAKGYPIVAQVWDDTTQRTIERPIPEEELIETQLVKMDAWFIEQRKIDEMLTERNNQTMSAADYKSIVVRSAKRDEGAYNFYDAVTNESEMFWGFRALDNCPFGKYVGWGNAAECLDTVNPEMRVGQWSDFEPRNMNRYFNETTLPNFHDLPISYQVNPFVWRNNQECDDPMPNDRVSIDYYAHDLKMQTDDTYPRRDHESRGGENHTAQFNSRSSSPVTGAEKSSGVIETPLRGDIIEDLQDEMQYEEEEVCCTGTNPGFPPPTNGPFVHSTTRSRPRRTSISSWKTTTKRWRTSSTTAAWTATTLTAPWTRTATTKTRTNTGSTTDPRGSRAR